MRPVRAGTLAFALALALASCGSDKTKTTSSTAEKAPASAGAKPVGAPGAKAVFVSPRQGSTVGTPVKAVVRLTGFKLSPSTVGKPAMQGEGHLHFAMDDGKFDQPKYSGANGQLAVKLGVQGKYSPSVAPTITYTGLPKGKHTLEVYLANNDHSNTGVEAKTSFTVR